MSDAKSMINELTDTVTRSLRKLDILNRKLDAVSEGCTLNIIYKDDNNSLHVERDIKMSAKEFNVFMDKVDEYLNERV